MEIRVGRGLKDQGAGPNLSVLCRWLPGSTQGQKAPRGEHSMIGEERHLAKPGIYMPFRRTRSRSEMRKQNL